MILPVKHYVYLEDILAISAVTNRFPDYYQETFQNSRIPTSPQRLLRVIWEVSTSIFIESLNGGTMITRWVGHTSIFASRANMSVSCFKKSLGVLVGLGLVTTFYCGSRLTALELSTTKITGDLLSYLAYHNKVALFDLLYTTSKFTCEEVLELMNVVSSLKLIRKCTIFKTITECRYGTVQRVPIWTNKNGEGEVMRQPIYFSRYSICGQRTPIINRTPIILKHKKLRSINFNANKYKGLTEGEKLELLSVAHLGSTVIESKLDRLKNLRLTKFTEQELDCINNFVPYYENLICSATGSISYKLLTSQYQKKSRHWKSLWKIYSLCIENGWDYKVYLDSQFESFSNWAASDNYKWPLPNMLWSERALKAFEAYIYRNETSYQNEGIDIKVKPKSVGTFQQEVEKKIQFALEIISTDLAYWSKHPMSLFDSVPPKNLAKVQKAKSIADHWVSDLPVEYLASIPEFLEFVGDKENYVPSLHKKLDLVEELQNNMPKMRVIIQVVKSKETSNNMPKTLDLTKLEEVLSTEEPVELW